MVDYVETVLVNSEPSDQESDDDPGRTFKPPRNQPEQRDPKFVKDDEVWFIDESESEKQAHIMKVSETKRVEQHYKGKKHIKYQYRLIDPKGVQYEKGKWVAETDLEFSGGT